jgi:hypothetical protein
MVGEAGEVIEDRLGAGLMVWLTGWLEQRAHGDRSCGFAVRFNTEVTESAEVTEALASRRAGALNR